MEGKRVSMMKLKRSGRVPGNAAAAVDFAMDLS